MKSLILLLGLIIIPVSSSLADGYVCQKCGSSVGSGPITGRCSQGGTHENIPRDGSYVCQKCGSSVGSGPLTGRCSQGGFHDNVPR